MFQLTNNFVVLFLATMVNFIATAVSWQRRHTRSGLYFASGMLCITVWTLTVGLEYAATSFELKVLFVNITYLAYNMAFIFFALFVLLYTGYVDWLDNAALKFFFYGIPISTVVLVWTNNWHHWLWQGLLLDTAQNNDLIFTHGPAYLWIPVTGYLMILFVVMPLQRASRKGVEFSKRQARLLFYASLIPVVGNIAYPLSTPDFYGVDLTSILFSISSVLFSLALYGTQLLDLLPIARDQVVAGLTDGMIVLDIQDRIVDVNAVAAGLIGRPIEALIGHELEEVDPRMKRLVQHNINHQMRDEVEISNEQKQYFDVVNSPLWGRDQIVAGHLIVFRDITDRKQAEADLERRFTEIQQLNQDLQNAQAQLINQQRAMAVLEERQRFARDLHDSVTQSIHGMVLYADTLTGVLEKNNVEQARRIMEKLRQSANQSLRETRLMLYQLQEVEADAQEGLIHRIKDRLSAVEERAGIEVELIEEGSLARLPKAWSENLFWMTVEAMNNSLKHAQASKVQVVIRCVADRFTLEVRDNGKGFDPLRVSTGGFGLKNMRTRAELLGGTLEIESSPSQGTAIRFSANSKMEQDE